MTSAEDTTFSIDYFAIEKSSEITKKLSKKFLRCKPRLPRLICNLSLVSRCHILSKWRTTPYQNSEEGEVRTKKECFIFLLFFRVQLLCVMMNKDCLEAKDSAFAGGSAPHTIYTI